MTAIPKNIIVSGDLTVDWNIAHIRRRDGDARVWNISDQTRACRQRGGAALLGDLIDAVAAELKAAGKGEFDVSRIADPPQAITPEDGRFHHSYAQWALFKYGDKSEAEPKAWRVNEFVGIDHSEDGGLAFIEAQLKDVAQPDVIVLDDADLGFRSRPVLWSKLLTKGEKKPWIVLKMSRPIAQGPLWDLLHREWAERLIVVMSVEDLRRTEVQISRELSWERTAQDLLWELVHNPCVNALSAAATVVCSFGTSGAFLLKGREGTLFFDPHGIEGTWSQSHPGGMIGYNSCLTAALVRELLASPVQPNFEAAVQSGIHVMRRLHQEGYGNRHLKTVEPCLFFPQELVAAALAEGQSPCSVAKVQDPAQPISAAAKYPSRYWTILHDKYPDTLDEVARRVVREGPGAVLRDVPLGAFGGLLTADRREIESFRGIRGLVTEYCGKGRQSKPLSIAVFGPPGAGKSFGVNEVARSLFPDLIKKVEFNVSQFVGPEDLHQALHQVRDVGLSGQIPLVFFDEFDAALAEQSLGWLRHFLMPMQDGAFLEGQIAHPLGAAIFVFAGGTSETLADFGKGMEPQDLRDRKVPDFVSRLKGYVDVMGPNPVGSQAGGDPHYLLRRALLLRSMLTRQARSLVENRGGKEILSIDAGVLNAFLFCGRYKHGARSMESIMAMSQLAGKSSFERSSLPSESQLDLHVNGLEFLALVQQIALTPEILEQLAAAAHEIYCQTKIADGFVWGPEKSQEKKTSPLLIAYADLPDWAKEANRVNVRTIPRKLAEGGYIMIPARSNFPPFEFPGPDLEKLAKLEHDLWMEAKLTAGFTLGQPTPQEPRRNEYLVAWEKLDESIKKIDRDLVTGIPLILAKAGYAVEKIRP